LNTLKGKQNEYYFDASRPFKKPGKFSTVFKGINNCGQSVLIKRLSEFKAENIYESKIINACFVKSIEYIETSEHVYLIRPFVEGIGLNELTKANWFASEKKILFLKRIIKEISVALESLHVQQLVHLDIRPHNIIVNASNSSAKTIVSIIDLDMVRPFYSSEEIMHFPLIYAAPELLLKKNTIIDNRTDIYAWSITLYELIFNKRPFAHANAELIMHLMLNKKLEHVDKRTNPLVDVLNKASNKHTFNLPPSVLDTQHVEELLLSGMNNRYINIESFTSDLLNTINYNKSWLSRLSQFFQR
jgi:serine/threonine protein kinase